MIRTDTGRVPPVTGAAGAPLVLWRSWIVAPEHRRSASATPMLTGLLGFPWRGPELDAKCTVQVRNNHSFSGRTVDRHHARIPDLDCTCGLYARRDGLESPRRAARGVPIAVGFVALSGLVLDDGENLRAQHARIVGPLYLLPGRLPVVDAVLHRAGFDRTPRSVAVREDRYSLTRSWRGIPLVEWRAEAARALRRRYGVEVR